MNKKIWYWTVGVIIIVIVVVFLASGHKSSQSSSVTHTTAIATQQSMHDLIASGITQMCTFSIAATATSSSMTGTIYMASQNVYGDFATTNTAGKVSNAHMIITNGTDYLWSDALGKGIKMSWPLATSSVQLMYKYGSMDMDQPAVYSCNSWTADQSKFALPTNIQFIDAAVLMRMRSYTQ